MGIDSVILTGIISFSCGGLSGYSSAVEGCTAGMVAFAKQNGIYENVKNAEERLIEKTEKKIKKNLDPQTIEAISATVLFVRLGMGEKSSFRLGKGPMGGDLVLETSFKEHFFKIRWAL